MADRINVRLPFLFKKLTGESDTFNDCILRFRSGVEYPFVRIVLAKQSRYFENYFKENAQQQLPVIVNMKECIDPNAMKQLLDLLYTNYIKLNVYNITPLLKIARQYEFPVICRFLTQFYLEASNDETLLHFVKEFIKNDLHDDALLLAPKIASHLYRIERNDPDEKITCTEIYQAVTPVILTKVLIEKNKLEIRKEAQRDVINSELYKYDIKEDHNLKNIGHIENFVKLYTVSHKLTDDDKESLSSAIEWDDESSTIQYFIHYKCDWVPARYSQDIIESILRIRNKRLTEFKKNLQKQPSQVSRWFSLSWIRTIKNIESPNKDLPIIEFIRTIGGTTKSIDPVKYGLIKVNSSPPLYPKAEPKQAIIKNNYNFAARTFDNKPPYISIDLGLNTIFAPRKVYLDSHFIHKKKMFMNEGFPQSVLVQVKNKKGLTNQIKLNITYDNNGRTQLCQFVNDGGSEFTFTLSGQTSNNSDLFRVSELEIIGNFQIKD